MTVKELIKELKNIRDKNQDVVFECDVDSYKLIDIKEIYRIAFLGADKIVLSGREQIMKDSFKVYNLYTDDFDERAGDETFEEWSDRNIEKHRKDIKESDLVRISPQEAPIIALSNMFVLSETQTVNEPYIVGYLYDTPVLVTMR